MDLFDELKKLLARLRKQKRSEYDRVLSFGDYISDRFEKAQYLGFGEGSSVYDSCLVLGIVSAGKKCWIGPYTILDGSGGGLSLGDNVTISAGVHIYTHDTVDRVIYGREITKAPVKIGSNVYIGPNVVVAKGVEIGDNVIIGANSLVNRSLPAGVKAFGNPARVVKKLPPQ